eukprot:TRINITY_DN7963_c0_g1_i1.p1 TRINITY_DN7963_c0_g1~~TRINITY_DN7963_c0_g1_i1.p1  ORF type:complete len:530 (+),score=136.25 TRINITY_DN7963_c0_g1_i1:97-1590(+)
MFDEVDCSLLVIFRVIWGAIIAYESFTYLQNDSIKMRVLLYNTSFNFHFYGFTWVIVPVQEWLMKLVLVICLLSAIGICIGLFYRSSASLFFLAFSYVYLCDSTNYLNHFYLVAIVSFILIFLPLNVAFSVDCLLEEFPKHLASNQAAYERITRPAGVPRWTIWILRLEFVLVYTFAGVAKMNIDWIRGEPLLHWLPRRAHYPIIGPILTHREVAFLFSWCGLLFDLLVGFMFLFPYTFYPALIGSFIFHLTNKAIFNIGIFPWMMLLSNMVFFNPESPRQYINYIDRRLFRGLLGLPDPIHISNKPICQPRKKVTLKQILVLVLVCLFLLEQLVVPLRFLAYDGDVAWTEYGHLFSWRMKLREKRCAIKFFLHNSQAAKHAMEEVDLSLHLNPTQISKMSSRPDMISEFAHHLASVYKTVGSNGARVEVYAHGSCSLNFRKAQAFINPTLDLSSHPVWAWPYPWLLDINDLSADESPQPFYRWPQWSSLLQRLNLR